MSNAHPPTSQSHVHASSSTPSLRRPTAATTVAEARPLAVPDRWTTYLCQCPPDTPSRAHSALTRLLGWLSTVVPSEAFLWANASASAPVAVLTVWQHRHTTAHQAIARLVAGSTRRCIAVEADSRFDRPRARVYSTHPDDDTRVADDVHNTPTGELRVAHDYTATVDAEPIPAHLADRYGITAPIYVDPASVPPEDRAPAPLVADGSLCGSTDGVGVVPTPLTPDVVYRGPARSTPADPTPLLDA